jgi:hypothetical protein
MIIRQCQNTSFGKTIQTMDTVSVCTKMSVQSIYTVYARYIMEKRNEVTGTSYINQVAGR